MVNPELLTKLRQAKHNALSAKYLHGVRKNTLHGYSVAVDILALAVPIAYVPVRLANWSEPVTPLEIVWECLAAALLIATVIKLALRWPDRAETHARLMGDNIGFAAQVDYLTTVYSAGKMEDEALNTFLLIADQDRADADILAGTSAEMNRTAYREALKELISGSTSVVCSQCGASPWQFTAGSCQLCGGTPLNDSRAK